MEGADSVRGYLKGGVSECEGFLEGVGQTRKGCGRLRKGGRGVGDSGRGGDLLRRERRGVGL